jgi:hypothetical protein
MIIIQGPYNNKKYIYIYIKCICKKVITHNDLNSRQSFEISGWSIFLILPDESAGVDYCYYYNICGSWFSRKLTLLEGVLKFLCEVFSTDLRRWDGSLISERLLFISSLLVSFFGLGLRAWILAEPIAFLE